MRLPRFSIRTLLALTILCALVAAYIANARRPYQWMEEQATLLTLLEKQGAAPGALLSRLGWRGGDPEQIRKSHFTRINLPSQTIFYVWWSGVQFSGGVTEGRLKEAAPVVVVVDTTSGLIDWCVIADCIALEDSLGPEAVNLRAVGESVEITVRSERGQRRQVTWTAGSQEPGRTLWPMR